MENKFDDFESYLKKQVNGYRMPPSGHVWTKVNNHLHGKQRFAVGTVIVMLLIMSLMYLTENVAVKNNNYSANGTSYPNPYILNEPSDIGNSSLPQQEKYTASPTKKPEVNEPVIVRLQGEQILTNTSTIHHQNNVAAQHIIHSQSFQSEQPKALLPKKLRVNSNSSTTILSKEGEEEEGITITKNSPTNAIQIEAKHDHHKIEIAELDLQQTNASSLEKVPAKLKNNLSNGLAFAVAAAHKTTLNSKKIRVQYYATPSISYRSLFDSREKKQNLYAGGIHDLDKAIFHKPALGLEAGVNWLFSMDTRLRLKTGFQFNYNRYNIKATSAQPEITTIALFGSARDLTSVSTLRNNEGFYPEWIENSNLQVSIPVGLEFTLANGKNIQLTLGSSIQPSLLLKNKMYLLSTDLKNYTQEPSLIRRLNVNGNIETFITLNTKKARWHIGPQLRYQILSTYTKEYPFKENLFDYGFKIGFSRPIK